MIIRSIGQVPNENKDPILGTLSNTEITSELEERRRIFDYTRSPNTVFALIGVFLFIFIIA